MHLGELSCILILKVPSLPGRGILNSKRSGSSLPRCITPNSTTDNDTLSGTVPSVSHVAYVHRGVVKAKQHSQLTYTKRIRTVGDPQDLSVHTVTSLISCRY